ncbi:tyrosinase family oxidase copper chaperone [Bradyrhizobium sp. HKCCYLS1011]|uniref:tyrosinase family oxidase copper chaperone n=1 Tax=Bradyrhizobium sp. HKCCYLS1011 TaxID=3420733 RepID=UPI003EB855C8
MGAKHPDANAPVARPQGSDQRYQGRRLSGWQALSRAHAGRARIGPHRPVVEGRQPHVLCRLHHHRQQLTVLKELRL